MASPPNQTAGTARAIVSLPYEQIEDVADQANTLELWYRYDGQTDDRMLSALPFADIASVYEPKIYVYTGTSSSLTLYYINGSKQRAVQIPANVGTTYFFKVTQGGAGTPLGASLTFRLDRAPMSDAPLGSVISTLDNTGGRLDWRTPILSATTPQILQFIQDPSFARAVTARMLANGIFLTDGDVSGNADLLLIYNPSLTNIYRATPSYFAFGPSSLASNNLDLFYLGYNNGAGIKEIRTLSPSGGESASAWTLPTASSGFTVDRANSILYYGAAGLIIKRYDLANSVGLTDLAASIGAGYNPHPDMSVMADGSILIGYYKVGGSPDNVIKRYDTTGAVLNTYNFAGVANGLHHIALGPNPLTFYVWMLSDFAGTHDRATYYEILASDGSTVRSAAYDVFNSGPDAVTYDPNYPDIEDVPRWGPEATCTFIVLPVAVETSNPIIYPSFNLASDMIRRVRQAPHLSNEQKWNYYHRFQLDFEAGGPRTSSTMEYQLQWSDDGGHTWSNLHTIHVGDEGQYKFRAVWRRLGRSRDRIFRVIDSNDDKAVWIDAFLDISPGEH
jgi:hypothetical protein